MNDQVPSQLANETALTASEPSRVYTAGRYVRALGVSHRSVLRRLQYSQPTRAVIVNGSAADAWSLADVPEGLRVQLNMHAARRGYRSAEQLIESTPEKPKYAPAWGKATEVSREKAAKLKRAMAATL